MHKTMKFPHLYVLAALTALLFSCDQIDPQNTISGVSPDKTSLNFLYSGGEETITITANEVWSLSTSAEWLSISQDNGTESATVTITAAPNPDKLNGRSAKLSLKYSTITLSINVTQEQNTEEAVFSISQNSFDQDCNGGDFEITVVSDVMEYDITIVDGWIRELSREGRRETGETIRFTADANDTDEARTGIVSVCTRDGSCIPVMINQAENTNPFFAHKNIGYRFTATWCGYCPYLDEAFHIVAEDPANNFNFITFHASSGYPMYIAESGTLSNYYKVSGYPTGVLNGWKEIDNTMNPSGNAGTIAGYIQNFEEIFPCVAGISASVAIKDGNINVEATVKAFPGDYLITAFVLESGIVKAQTYYPTSGGSQKVSDYVHDNVARTVLTESPKGDAFRATQEATKFNWSVALSADWVPENLSVAIMVNRAYGSRQDKKTKKSYPDNYVVNSVVVPVGESVEMQYEE